MKPQLEQLLSATLERLRGTALPEGLALPPVMLEPTRDPAHGDYASNVALRLAKAAGRPARELAEAIVAALPPSPILARAEVAGPGFINLHLARAAASGIIAQVLEQAERFGTRAAEGERVIVEFVSANPTGPLHVGHGRQAAYGATLSNLLAAVGQRVHREYYINDAGRQMDILAVSTWLRYLQQCGETVPFPSNGYRGDYVNEIAAALRAEHGDALRIGAADVLNGLPPDAPEGDKELHTDALIARMRTLLGERAEAVLTLALSRMLADIRADLAEFGVLFDRWYSERELTASGAVDHAIARLRERGELYERDGATWFRSSRFGDDEDRVLVRANGQRTYFAPDIAYHLQKRERGFDRLIDVLGADHHGYVARVRGSLVAMGEPGEALEACLIQFVSLFRGGEKVPMGKREAQFVTLRQLRSEVGNDACRFFYLMRSHDQPLDFDLELAKSRTNENPVYYIQYVHARVSSLVKQAAARSQPFERALALSHLERLDSAPEQAVLRELARYPDVIVAAAGARAPHMLVHYLRELAHSFHTWYNASTFLVDDAPLRNARLALALAVQQVVRNALGLLGVSAPESM